jgi:predicted Fe-Mo cluster-binding NifX family protein
MRFCITAQGNDLNAAVDPRFGRCRYFWIIDTVSDKQEILENLNSQNSGGAGIQSAQLMVSKGVEAVLTGSVGPNASQVLNPAGIKIHTGVTGKVTEAIHCFKNSDLKTT